MVEIKNVVIGIQARSTSTRYPGKILEDIDGKPMIQRVVDNANECARYMNRHQLKTRVLISVVCVVPTGDTVIPYLKNNRIRYFEGAEHDVLSRYLQMAERLDADYVVRVTADCPNLPPPYIQKAIKSTLMNHYDYFSNVDEDCRTAPDGYDVEVMSRPLLRYADEHAKTPPEREHVTLFMRKSPPDWAQRGFMEHYADLSHLKWSVDEEVDRERVTADRQSIRRKREIAEAKYGRQHVHKF